MPPSLSKHSNALLAGYSYLKSIITGSAEVHGMPPAIGVELTNNCNLNCPECSTGSGLMSRSRGFMDITLFEKLVRELKPYLYNINLYFQGEPMMHPLFTTFLNGAGGVHSVVSTNGHYLTAENSARIAASGLARLIVSLDGTDQEIYSVYRKNGSFDTVKEGLRNITEARDRTSSRLKIEIQFLVSRINQHQIAEVKKLAEKLKVTLHLKSMQVLNKENAGTWLPSIGSFSRYRMGEGHYEIKNRLPNRCARLWFNPVITWDGNVLPCCFDKDAEYIMGNLKNDSFRDIWDGPKYRIFRKSVLSGRHMIEICTNCTSGMRRVRT